MRHFLHLRSRTRKLCPDQWYVYSTDAKQSLTQTGTPLSELRSTKDVKVENKNEIKKPGAITFVRSRMLYARATMNAKGGVRFGMRHIRKWNDLEGWSYINMLRRLKSLPGSKRQEPNSPHHEVHLPAPIRPP